MNTTPLVASVQHVDVHFGQAHVLKDVSLDIPTNTVIGLVGESGSGKSTLAKLLVGMVRPSAGRAEVLGHELKHLNGRRRRVLSRRVQMIPQDPYASLSPRRTIGETLAEAIDPLRPNPARFASEISDALSMLGIDPNAQQRFPHEFSGGQRQRIAIARALIVNPDLIVADEVTSALDVIVQAEVIRVLQELKLQVSAAMLFVTHNLAVAQEVCDDVAVMRQGEIVEYGPISAVYRQPTHEYTRTLLSSVPGAQGFTLERTVTP